MPLWFYKSYWHINLLEFQGNKYRAVIEGCDGNYIYAGFNYGLIPSFTITGDDENSNISVTLTETSLHGSYFSDVFDPQGDTATTWDYVVTVSGNSYYECSDDEDGVGIYVLMAEVRGNGIRTGRYKVLEGHESEFTFLNVVGTFSDIVTFTNSDCGNGQGGGGGDTDSGYNTNIYGASLAIGECKTFFLSNNRHDWLIKNIPAGFTFTPYSGVANTTYYIEVCNVSAPVGSYTYLLGYLSAGEGGDIAVINSISSGTSITPKSITANCNSQTVTFSFNASCPLTVTSIPASLTYTLGNSTLQVTIPANTQTTQRTFNITVKDCRNVSETVTIVQSGIYEEWRTISGEYVCQSGDKYTKERRYTGTTSSSMVATSETRAGTLIESGSTACSTTTYRWYDDGRFFCNGTTKYQALLEQVSYNGGETWNYTGNAKYGTNLGTDGTFCDGTETYTWTPTDNFECYDGSTPIKTPEYLERTANANGYIGLGEEFGENTVIEIDFQMTQAMGYSIIGDKMPSDSDDWRVFLNYDTTANNLLNYDFIDSRVDYNTGDWSKRFHLEIGNYYVKDLDTDTVIINSTPKTGFTRGTQMYLFHLEDATQASTDYGRIYSVKIKQNGTLVKDYIPWTDMNGNYGLYDQVANTIHQSTGQMTGSTVVNDVQIVQSGGNGSGGGVGGSE